jgi:hypothetical protein
VDRLAAERPLGALDVPDQAVESVARGLRGRRRLCVAEPGGDGHLALADLCEQDAVLVRREGRRRAADRRGEPPVELGLCGVVEAPEPRDAAAVDEPSELPEVLDGGLLEGRGHLALDVEHRDYDDLRLRARLAPARAASERLDGRRHAVDVDGRAAPGVAVRGGVVRASATRATALGGACEAGELRVGERAQTISGTTSSSRPNSRHRWLASAKSEQFAHDLPWLPYPRS